MLKFDRSRLERARDLLERSAEAGAFSAASLCVGGIDGVHDVWHVGPASGRAGVKAVDAGTRFLVASLTKPVTATAVMKLVESGAISLDDRVDEFLPSLGRRDAPPIRIRHLLTHTSGLPDMVPENEALRASHAGLAGFVEATGRARLLFAPGTGVSYQSMGFALLAEVVRAVSGVELSEYLERELFSPLEMRHTSLGRRGSDAQVVRIELEPAQERTDWNWNTSYWLDLGVPWGGLLSTAGDLGRFCRMMLGSGALSGVRVLSPATVGAVTRNQLGTMPEVPEVERRCRPWGLGWRLHWPGVSAHFGDLLGPRSYGHWGSTGTLMWVDPDAGAFLVLLTNRPCGEAGTLLARVSNLVASSWV